MTIEQELAELRAKVRAQESLTRQALDLAARHARQHGERGTDPLLTTGLFGAGAQQANTTPSTFSTLSWGNKTGNARHVPVWDNATGRFVPGYLTSVDILTPPQILTFSDSLSATFEIDNGGTRSPSFLLTYEGTPSACIISMDSQMETDLEVSAGNYPQTLTGDFGVTAEAGAAINNATTAAMINRTYTWTATATVDGVTGLTLTTTLRWLNRVYVGPHTDTQIDTAGILEVDATGDGESALKTTIAGTYSAIRVSGSEYLWVCHRSGSDIATIIDASTGFAIDGEYKTNVTHTNDSGFQETFRVWRSTNTGILDHAPNVTITV